MRRALERAGLARFAGASQLAWMDEEYLANDPAVSELSAKGKNFTEEDKSALREKQHELLAAVLPEYRLRGGARADRNFDDAVLPPDSAAVVRHGHRAHIQSAYAAAASALSISGGCARAIDAAAEIPRESFGKPPAGLWPSEGRFRIRR